MKRMFAAFIAAALMLSSVWVCSAEQNRMEIYVSAESGNDIIGKGTKESPYKTFEKAKEAVKELRKKKRLTVPVDVIFRQGEYRISKTINFTKEESGSEISSTTFKSADGERAVIKGSVEINVKDIKPVDDVDTLSILPIEARGKVGYFELEKYGITSINGIYYYDHYQAPKNIGYVSLFLNGKKQPLAQWPNGENVYSSYEKTVNPGGSGERGAGGTIQLKDYRLKRWTTAKDMHMHIFGGNDYAMDTVAVASVNPDEKQVTFKTGTGQGLNSAKSRRFKAINLLEELDMPGEWFVDREKLILYYYPEQSLKDGVLEFAYPEINLITMQDTSYIGFENLDFSQIRGNVFWTKDRCDNLKIDNCNFENIGSNVLWQFSNKQSKLGGNSTQAYQFREDGARNISITNCSFDNIGREAIKIRQTGSFDDYIEGNSIIENNIFTNTNCWSMAGYAVCVEGIKVSIKNNLFYNLPSAVSFVGIDMDIANNEIYNIQRYVSDSGAIYTGRNYITRDNRVYGNYIKDVSNKDPHMNTNYNRFVYLDDAHAGTYVYSNIFVGKAHGAVAVNGGQDNHVYDNVLVNNEQALLVNSWTVGDKGRIEKELELAKGALANPKYKKYHQIIKLGISEKYLGMTALNEVYGNVVIGGKNEISDENYELSAIGNNPTVDESVFEDPQNGDYRIKDETLKEEFPLLPTKESFDYSKVGIDESKFTVKPQFKQDFKLLYPKNGEKGIDSKEMSFEWERAKGADRYRFVLARDKELKDIVEDKTVYENACTSDKITDGNQSYYWKVYAYNDSLKNSQSWESVGVCYNFTTAKSFSADTDALDALLMSGKKRLAEAVEGDEVGQYAKGYRDKLEGYLKKTEDITGGKIRVTYDEAEKISKELDDLLNNDIYVKGGYINLGDIMSDKEKWITNDLENEFISFTDDGIKVTPSHTKNLLLGYDRLSDASKKIIMCFRLKPDLGEKTGSDWIGFGMRGRTGEVLYQGGNNQYFITLKEGILEYQKNSGGSNKLLTTVENSAIRSGEWIDIQFGVVDLNDIGVLTILMINGKVAYRAIDTDDSRVKNKGTLTFMTSTNTGFEIAGTSEKNFEDINKLVSDYSYIMTEETCKKIQDEIGDNTIIAKTDSKKAYVSSALKDIAFPLELKNAEVYIGVDEISSVLGGTAYKQNGKIYVEYKGKSFVFENMNSAYTVDGIQKNLNNMPSGDMVPLSNIAEDGGMMYFANDKGLVFIMQKSAMNYANYDSLLDAAAKSLEMYK